MELASKNKVVEKRKVSPFDKRIHEIDFARGFLILLVVMDHLFYNLGHYGGLWHIDWMEGFFMNWYYQGLAREIIQPLALFSFCFVSGVSCAFSRNNWKRAIETLILWGLIALGSNVLQLLIDSKTLTLLGEGTLVRIDFNIIGVLGFSILLYCLIQKRSFKAIIAMILGFFVISTYLVPMLNYGLSNLCGSYSWQSPRPGSFIPGSAPNFYFPFFWEPLNQADYVPLFPYVLFFFLGVLFSYFVYRDRRKSLVKHKGNWEKPICFLGRHTLIIYLTHIFIIMGIFALINVFVGGK